MKTICEREHRKAVDDYLRRRPFDADLSPLLLSKKIYAQMHERYCLQDRYLVTIFPDLLEKAAQNEPT